MAEILSPYDLGEGTNAAAVPYQAAARFRGRIDFAGAVLHEQENIAHIALDNPVAVFVPGSDALVSLTVIAPSCRWSDRVFTTRDIRKSERRRSLLFHFETSKQNHHQIPVAGEPIQLRRGFPRTQRTASTG